MNRHLVFVTYLLGFMFAQVGYAAEYAVTDLGEGFVPFSVNMSGEVVGQAGRRHAVSYLNGVIKDLGPGAALAINDLGHIVGTSFLTNGPFLYQNGSLSFISGFPGGGAYAINNTDQILFAALDTTGSTAVVTDYLYDNGVIQSLGPPPWSLNNNGPVAGNATNDHGQMVSGDFFDINNKGQMVGTSSTTHTAILGNFPSTIEWDLNALIAPSDWVLEKAFGINDLGQIVGTGINPNGKTAGYLLTPTAAVPVPMALSLFVSGLIALGMRVIPKRSY